MDKDLMLQTRETPSALSSIHPRVCQAPALCQAMWLKLEVQRWIRWCLCSPAALSYQGGKRQLDAILRKHRSRDTIWVAVGAQNRERPAPGHRPSLRAGRVATQGMPLLANVPQLPLPCAFQSPVTPAPRPPSEIILHRDDLQRNVRAQNSIKGKKTTSLYPC